MYIEEGEIKKVLFFNTAIDDENIVVLKTAQDIADLGLCMKELSEKLKNFIDEDGSN